MIEAVNPIMPGFYPDPSMCAVGEDFYLCNSTFSYFPGLSVMHSKDLVHWEQIGNVLDRESQLPLGGGEHSAGLFAPTIRYYNGTYYVICTNTTINENFIVTAESPEGPWSEMHILKGADGIDPSLFFDEDGKCYYCGTHPNPEGPKYNGDWYIYVSEVDIENFELIGEKKNVWNGALKGCIWPEGPHIYKENGYYYIMHAEGGTGPEHSVMICRSKNIFGPYENNPKNPILTHRHLGKDFPIKYVGHADLVRSVNGEWFLSMLAVRPLECYTTMGRETFLAKCIWEEDWPVINPGVGMLTDMVEVDLPSWDPLDDPDSYTNRTGRKNTVPGSDKAYDFTKVKELGEEFLFLRNPKPDMYKIDRDGLQLKLQAETIKDLASPSYISIRQQHHRFESSVTFDYVALKDKECAGIALVQNNLYNLRVELKAQSIDMILCQNGKEEVIGSIDNVVDQNSQVKLSIVVDGLVALGYAADKKLGETSVANLSTEVAGGFVGCCIGMYASGNGNDGGYVNFKELTYKAK